MSYPRGATDIGLTISVGIKALDISVSMPEDFGNQTSGLLGNFNGDKTDDFRFPNDTLVGRNLSDRQIYEKYAPYCEYLPSLSFSLTHTCTKTFTFSFLEW